MSGQNQSSRYLLRQSNLMAALELAGLDALALNPGSTLTYLTGLHFHLMERPTVILFAPHADPVIILPELEVGKISSLDYPIRSFAFGDDPSTWAAVFKTASQAAGIDGRRVGVEPRALRFLELRILEGAAPQAHFVSAEATLSSLRVHKDESEIASMRQAVDIAQKALQATLPAIRVGASERELASELTLQLLQNGSDTEFPFRPIIAGGPNSANPHSVPTDRKLQQGDLLIIDWGAAFDGYISDLTRTFAIGKIDPELERIYHVVAEANAAGRSAARPGVPAGQVDAAARAVIEKAGYGKFFIHRTGHGIGMEGHEEPYIYGENALLLEPGMTFTVEPGIYLPGRGGVRIEDNVAITASGAESLSDMSRQFLVLDR